MAKSRWTKKKDRSKARKYAEKTNREARLNRTRRQGYVLKDGVVEHRLVWKAANGKIPKGWVVHHVNEVKNDNRLENLVALPSAMHDHLHKIQREHQIRYSKEQLEAMLDSVKARDKQIKNEIKDLEQRLELKRAELDKLGWSELQADRINAESSSVYFGPELPANFDKPFIPKVIRRPKVENELISVNDCAIIQESLPL